MEMVVAIYESADGVRGHKPDPEGTDIKRGPDTAPHTGGDTTWSRCYRLIAVCVVLLCVLLLIVVIMLSIKYNNLKTNNNNLIIERAQSQRQREELQRFFKEGWTYFNSCLYYISTEQKNWTEGRQNCSERGADLVIINSTEEQEFVTKLLGGGRGAWIGLSGRDGENKWKWVDDTPLITGFWGRGGQNSAAADEDCVVTGDRTDPVDNWADYPCRDMNIWICEKTIFN